MTSTQPFTMFLGPAMASLLLACVAPTMAEEPPVTAEPPHELDVRLTAGVWLTRLGGTSMLRNGADRSLDLQDDLNLRDLEATFNAELNIRRHDFFDLHLSGFSFSTESSGTYAGTGIFGDVHFTDGDPYRASLDLTSVNGEVRFAVYRPFSNSSQEYNADGRRRINFRFGPTVGARYIDVEQTVEHVGVNRAKAGGEWLAIQAGMHFELMFRPDRGWPWIDRFGLEAAGSGGPVLGGDGGAAWQVQSTFRMYFTENFAVHIGYRMMELNARNNGYRLNGGLQGLFLGGTLAF